MGEYEPYPDNQALAGPDAPQVKTIVDLIRYCASIHHRFGNTCVEVDGEFLWGGSALRVRSERAKEVERLTTEAEGAYFAGYNEGYGDSFQSQPNRVVDAFRRWKRDSGRPTSDICEWTDNDYDWKSSCGKSWDFEYDGPIENGVKFCMNCGKPVVIIAADSRRTQDDTKAQKRLERDKQLLDYLAAEKVNDHARALFRRNRPITRGSISAALYEFPQRRDAPDAGQSETGSSEGDATARTSERVDQSQERIPFTVERQYPGEPDVDDTDESGHGNG